MTRFVSLLLLLSGAVFMLTVPRSIDAASGIEWPQVGFGVQPYRVEDPTFLTHAGDGSGRLFIVQQDGKILIVDDGHLLETPFLDLTNEVIFIHEQGLLSMAFSPNYTTNGEFYVNYSERTTGGDTYVVRYRVSADNPNVADPDSAEIVLTVEQPYDNHNGGQLQFGPDGMLYIGMGDGGNGGDPQNNAQNPASLLGKMLRIDVETGNPATYTIPPDNPFVSTPGYRGEIWQLGLRNPWRFSFDRETGDMYIGDVGQGLWEEINFQPASSTGGENWGWRCYEGTHEYDFSACDKEFPYDMPIIEYNQEGNPCAVTGGYVYRGDTSERMNGVYFYTDFCTGTVTGVQNAGGGTWVSQELGEVGFAVSSFGEGEDGSLFLLDPQQGRVIQMSDIVHSIALPLTLHDAR